MCGGGGGGAPLGDTHSTWSVSCVVGGGAPLEATLNTRTISCLGAPLEETDSTEFVDCQEGPGVGRAPPEKHQRDLFVAFGMVVLYMPETDKCYPSRRRLESVPGVCY